MVRSFRGNLFRLGTTTLVATLLPKARSPIGLLNHLITQLNCPQRNHADSSTSHSWTSGCGEFDLFEVLDSGNFRCKSTLHMAPAGGSSDWFQRPTGGSITAAVVIAGEHEVAAIRVLDGGQSFDATLSEDVVSGWVNEAGSVFKMEG